MTGWHWAGYVGLAVVQAICTQAAILIGAGQIPAPLGQAWVLPLISAGLVTLSALLPRASDLGRSRP